MMDIHDFAQTKSVSPLLDFTKTHTSEEPIKNYEFSIPLVSSQPLSHEKHFEQEYVEQHNLTKELIEEQTEDSHSWGEMHLGHPLSEADSHGSDSSDSPPGRGIITPIHKKKRKISLRKSTATLLRAIPLASDSEDDLTPGSELKFDSPPSSPVEPCIEDLESRCNFQEQSTPALPEPLPQDEFDSMSNAESLCPCTSATVGDVYFMVLNLGLKHGLTWAAQVDVLKVIGSLYDKKIPHSKHLYLKEHSCIEKNITYHLSCNVCEAYLGQKESVKLFMNCHNKDCLAEISVLPTEEEVVCQQCKMNFGNKKKLNLKSTRCVNDNCKKVLSINGPENFFLTLSIQSQFQTFLKDSQFVKKVMTHRFNRKSTPETFSDIYDGRVYKKLFENGNILSSPYNFSYSFFIDGMAYGNTSTKTIWPIYLTINELPYEERSKYIILAGLYVGSKEPNVQTLLRPFTCQANELSRNGFEWDHNGRTVRSYAVALCCIADSVARCKVLNLMPYGSFYGCTFCYKLTQPTAVGRRFSDYTLAPLRSSESLRQDLCEVYLRRHKSQPRDRTYKGVKGVTALLDLDHFCIGSNIPVDFLHNVCLGVTKLHLELIFDSVRKNMWIEHTLGKDHIEATLDDRVKNMQSCSSVIRELRPVKDRKNWRGSEFRLWLLFYGIPCLKGVLKPQYLLHFSLLSKAIHLLLKKEVLMVEIRAAHEMLMLFTVYFKIYFGEENMKYNIHLLSHIAEGVQNFGPLWTHNAFLYESQNRYTRRLAKNPNSVIQEIAKKFLIYRSLPLMCCKMVKSEKTLSTCEDIFGKKLKKFFRCDNGCVLVGRGTPYILSQGERDILQKLSITSFDSCLSYKRMILQLRRYCTVEYCKTMKNNDSCALLSNGHFVFILDIWLLPNNATVLLGEILRVSNRLTRLSEFSISIDHIRTYDKSRKLLCFLPQQIVNPCALMNTASGNYVSAIPYGCSVE